MFFLILKWQGKQLENHHELKHYRISSGATVNLAGRLRGGLADFLDKKVCHLQAVCFKEIKLSLVFPDPKMVCFTWPACMQKFGPSSVDYEDDYGLVGTEFTVTKCRVQ